MNIEKFIFNPQQNSKLSDFKTDEIYGFTNDKDAEKELEKGVKRLSELQELLYAQDQYSLLIIFQAMDAAGKDSTIKHVMSGINPQGCTVTSFKAPSSEELDHNFLWRCMKVIPAKGDIGIFNRSYYEEVLIVRVHPEILASQKLPIKFENGIPGEDFWSMRYSDINNFEQNLTNNGTHILKFFLHVSKEEQKERFLKRIDSKEKNWKFSVNDIFERRYWDDYQFAYQKMMEHTSTADAPWYVIPADHKWFMQLAVCKVITEKLKSFNLHFPELTAKQIEELRKGKELLSSEK
jgi:PPK2 family polyphosphate:nucleotide phosphotransferase